MTYIQKILDYIFIIFNIPSTIIISILIIFILIKDYKLNGLKSMNDNEHRNNILRNLIEGYSPYGKHINIAFWILIIYFIYF